MTQSDKDWDRRTDQDRPYQKDPRVSLVWTVLVCPSLYFEIFNINFVSKEVLSWSKRTLRVPKFLLIKSVLIRPVLYIGIFLTMILWPKVDPK